MKQNYLVLIDSRSTEPFAVVVNDGRLHDRVVSAIKDEWDVDKIDSVNFEMLQTPYIADGKATFETMTEDGLLEGVVELRKIRLY